MFHNSYKHVYRKTNFLLPQQENESWTGANQVEQSPVVSLHGNDASACAM
jgi:hypothetical protein